MAANHVSEIVYIPLKPNTDLTTGDDNKILDEVTATTKALDGVKSIYAGRQVENWDVLQLVIIWTSKSAETAFLQSPDYAPYREKFATLMGGAPTMFHTHLPEQPSIPPNPFQAPVTECISGFFAPEEDQDAWTKENWGEFLEIAKEQQQGIGLGSTPSPPPLGITGAWTLEPAAHENLGEGVEGKVFAAFIGWPSVEEHLQFRGTEPHKRVTAPLRKSIKGLRVHHVAFTQYK